MTRSPLAEKLTRGDITLLDGALGTELERRGIATSLPLWSARALVDAPDRVREIHEEYVRAGADILTADTFRTTPRSLGKAEMADESDRLTALAITLCREARDRAAGQRVVFVAGSMAPLEDCYRPELTPPPDALEREHAEQAERLARAGADLILVETMGTIREAAAAVRGAKRTGLLVFASFICLSADEIWGGEPLAEAARAVTALDVDAVLVNCIPVEMVPGCLGVLARSTPLPTGCYPNAGGPEMASGTWRFDPGMTPARFAEAGGEWVKHGVRIVGGCCGTGPDHIRALRTALPPVLLE
jgi:S-methylmethionine-dependent homocysteine/selenocysteine methylase